MKRIMAGVLAFTMVFGSLAMPAAESGVTLFDTAVTAEAASYEGFSYSVLADGTVKINYYFGDEENLIIPGTIEGRKVTIIDSFAFEECENLISVTIPGSVEEIRSFTFRDFTSLEKVTISKGVKIIGGNAFSGCTNLKSVTIPDSVTTIGYNSFEGCESLASVTIPDSVTRIWSFAFGDCTSLKSITIPDSVTELDAWAFEGCTSLTSVTIPGSVENVGQGIFRNCTGLKSATISEGVPYIETCLFEGCTSLTSISIPKSVTRIGSHAFENTPWLKAKQKKNPLVIVDGFLIDGSTASGNVVIPNSVTSIVDEAFSGLSSLTGITIPDSVTSMGYGTFKDCTSLTSVTIPDSVTGIDDNAFSGCTNLERVSIPKNVTYIGGDAFSDCTSLTSITIPDSVTSIGFEAFINCTGIKSITISRNVTYIGDTAIGFYYDSNGALKKVPGFKIKCYSDTAGEKYALDYGIDYELLDGKTIKVGTVKTTDFSCTDTAVRINWNKASNASGYRIYRYNTSTKKWNTVATLSGGNTLTYKQTGLKAGTTYKYKVKAYVKSNGSTYWGEASSTMTTTTKPAKPVIKSSYGATSNAIRIKWTPVTGATGYRVYRYDTKTKKYEVIATIKDGTANTYRDSKSLKAKTSYKYKVKAYRSVGGVHYWGDASAVKTCKTK